MTVAQVVESNSFDGKNKATYFLWLKSSIKICQTSIKSIWLCIFWALGLDIYCIGGKRTYSWYKLLIFKSFGNNIYKDGGLTIEDGRLLCLSEQELLFDCYFEINIIVIWEFTIMNSKKFKL